MSIKNYFLILCLILNIAACKSKKQKSVNTEPVIITNNENISYKDPKWTDSSNFYLTNLESTKFSGLENNLEKIKALGYNAIVFDVEIYEEVSKYDSIDIYENIKRINPKLGSEKEFEILARKAKAFNLKLIMRIEPNFFNTLNINNVKDKSKLSILTNNLNYWIKNYDIAGFYSQFTMNENSLFYIYSKLKNKEILFINGNRFSIITASGKFVISINSKELFQSSPIYFFDSLINLQNTNFSFVQEDIIKPSTIIDELYFSLLSQKKLISKNTSIEVTLLNNLITNNSSLWTGEKAGKYQKLNNIVSNQENVLCYKRYNDSNEVIFILNLSNKPAEAGFIDLENYTNVTEYFSGKKYDDLLSIDLKPMEYLVFAKK